MRIFILVNLAALLSALAFAQPLRFEVASVKPGGTQGPRTGITNPEHVSYPNTILLNVIREAYGVESEQISGPDWLSSERFAIDARARRARLPSR